MRDELLYESRHSRVSRVVGPDGVTTIYKEALGSGAARRARHERDILNRLAGVPGVPRLAAEADRPEVLLLEDTGAESLEATLCGGRMDVDHLLGIACDLVETIAGVHRHGIIHKDISPANILVRGTPSRPMLIDFGLSSMLAEERPGFTHHHSIVGTPAYIAPEQTGRTGWPVDQRADLYGLGATLYELATGAPPFGDGDLLRLVHDHLTRLPVPAREINPDIPAVLSETISHLLEKEPDRRYQSAEGVLRDLHRIREAWGQRTAVSFTPGERDFPWRLAPPSRLVGRSAEIDVLAAVFADAAGGRCRGVLVSGRPGVGKTVLVDELRPLATAGDGWFLTGKFDQYRRDAGSDALQQTAQAMARMLLAEPESELAPVRARLCDALGTGAGLLVSAVPELRPVLGVMEAPPGDPDTARARLQHAALALLGAVASPDRPVVVVLDDLQWAGAGSIDFVDAVLAADHLRGVLLVGAYRESEVDETHPLTAMLRRWQSLDVPPWQVRLDNLGPGDLCALLAEMLRMPATRTAALAELIRSRTDGNPFDTVELVNALRREGALVPGDDGWTWDAVALCRYLGQGDVVDLLADRISALAEPTRELLEIMACLGNQVELDLLQAAVTAEPFPDRAAVEPFRAAVEPFPERANAEPDRAAAGQFPAGASDLASRLSPALEEGLLVMEHGRATSVQFRHDRVQQAAYGVMSPHTRRARHLALARRLADAPSFRVVPDAGYQVVAAGQYLSACDELTDPAERRRVARLFRVAADEARNLGNHALVDRYLAAAGDLIEANPGDSTDVRLRRELEIERHAALTALGRFAEVDQLYRRIQRDNDNSLERAKAAWVQVSSLLSRGEPREGLDLGMAALADLGHPVPSAEDLPAEIERGLDRLREQANRGADADLRRPISTDPTVAAVARIINRMIPAAYFSREPVMPWLVTEAARLWDEGGPSAALVGPLAHTSFVTIEVRQDYATGYAAVRRVLTASENRGYEPDTSQARFLFSVSAAPWFEPLEETIRQARRARDGLIRGGDLQNACFTHFATTPQLMDCAPELDDVLADLNKGLEFARRTGNDVMGAALVAHQQTIRSLRGLAEAPGAGDEPPFDEQAYLAATAANPNAAATYHLARALTAALLGEPAVLGRHIAAARPLLPFVEATQCITWAHLLCALDTAERIRRATARDRSRASLERPGSAHEGATLLVELDRCRGWMARRAAEAPGNFLHLRCLIDAERAWALGDADGALDAFDRARRAVAALRRPWHQALINERLALFHFWRGAQDSGRIALREARQHYRAWGAVRKVEKLDQAHPFLTDDSLWSSVEARSAVDARRSANISSDTVDMLAVLRASQALSSETNLAGLQSRVREVLSALTGATSVQVLLRNKDDWILPPADATSDAIGVAEAGRRGLLPLSACRYVERTREPLLVEDAARDDRFRRDPHLRDVGECSLMVVPIMIRGELNAMLVLENQGSRAALCDNRLDTVLLIAGQLSVSLDNAMLYAALEHKVTERTEALREANERLELLAVTDPLTGLANRRRLTDALETQWRRCLRIRSPIAIAMIDIDHFKLYNDYYGHPAGDECLRKVASVINRTVRQTDLPARYGGEEFAVVLPDTDEPGARDVAERVRRAVVDLEEPNARALHDIVTVSVGVAATMPARLDRAEQLIKIADAELYRAKRAGRNQVSSCRS